MAELGVRHGPAARKMRMARHLYTFGGACTRCPCDALYEGWISTTIHRYEAAADVRCHARLIAYVLAAHISGYSNTGVRRVMQVTRDPYPH